MSFLFKKTAILGFGLIGSSLARAIREQALATMIVCGDTSAEVCRKALDLKLADAAVIDSRVLMAHRFGPGETAWPAAEDRFASDLLLWPAVADPWLRAFTASAAAPATSAPILLGGHTLVNGGLRLLAQRARAGGR